MPSIRWHWAVRLDHRRGGGPGGVLRSAGDARHHRIRGGRACTRPILDGLAKLSTAATTPPGMRSTRTTESAAFARWGPFPACATGSAAGRPTLAAARRHTLGHARRLTEDNALPLGGCDDGERRRRQWDRREPRRAAVEPAPRATPSARRPMPRSWAPGRTLRRGDLSSRSRRDAAARGAFRVRRDDREHRSSSSRPATVPARGRAGRGRGVRRFVGLPSPRGPSSSRFLPTATSSSLRGGSGNNRPDGALVSTRPRRRLGRRGNRQGAHDTFMLKGSTSSRRRSRPRSVAPRPTWPRRCRRASTGC